MLEAREACSGTTGRNGGQSKAALYRSFSDREQQLGLSEAIRIARMDHSYIQATCDFAREHHIDCACNLCNPVDMILSSQVHLQPEIWAIERFRRNFRM
jgi:hypothetical protein